jgi:hypothetical protein
MIVTEGGGCCALASAMTAADNDRAVDEILSGHTLKL